jgi:hypothetical protein
LAAAAVKGSPAILPGTLAAAVRQIFPFNLGNVLFYKNQFRHPAFKYLPLADQIRRRRRPYSILSLPAPRRRALPLISKKVQYYQARFRLAA